MTRPECPKNIEFSSSNLFLFVKGCSRFILFLFSRFSLLIFEVDKLVDKEQQGDDDTWRKICINANPIGLNCNFYQVPTWWRCLRCSKSRTSQFLNECYTPSNEADTFSEIHWRRLPLCKGWRSTTLPSSCPVSFLKPASRSWDRMAWWSNLADASNLRPVEVLLQSRLTFLDGEGVWLCPIISVARLCEVAVGEL